MHNWTYIMQNFMEWSTQGYNAALGVFFWPLVFTAILGYVYLKQQSLTAVAAGILIIFAAFFNALVISVQPWINFLYVAVAAIIAGLFLFALFLRGRNK